jgi:hypothetical protein
MDRSTLLAALAVTLAVSGLSAFAIGELLVAGVLMLGTSFAIYVRETRT